MPFHDHHKDWTLIGFLVVLLGAALYIISPYLSAIFTGALIAYALYPAYAWLSKTTKSERLGGIALSVIAVALLTLLVTFLVASFSAQAASAYSLANTYLSNGTPIEHLSFTGLNSTQIEAFKGQALTYIQQAPRNILPHTTALINNILSLFLFMVVAIFATSYFLIKGKSLRQTIIESLPLRDHHRDKIVKRFDDTISAVVKGVVGTSILQGAIAGLIFFFAGVPASILLGFLTMIAAFIPSVGVIIVWLPVVALLFLQGKIWTALVVTIISTIVLGYIDNIQKPQIIGDSLKMNPFIIFIAVMGGIGAFGILGIFIGPLLFALVSTCLEIYKQHIH